MSGTDVLSNQGYIQFFAEHGVFIHYPDRFDFFPELYALYAKVVKVCFESERRKQQYPHCGVVTPLRFFLRYANKDIGTMIEVDECWRRRF